MKNRSLSILIEDCLRRLDQGESLPDLLSDYPDQAHQLQPLLLVAMASRAFPLPKPSQSAQRLGRNQMLAEMNRIEIKQAFRKKAAIPPVSTMLGNLSSALRAGGFTRLAYSYRLASVFLVLILSGGFFTLNASASSQPGDFLYSLKLRLEQAGLTVSYAEEEASQLPPQPWEFGYVVWALEGVPDFFGDQDNGFTTADLDGDDETKIGKDLKEADREAAKDAAEADREADKVLKEADKDAAVAEREVDQDLKEDEKDAAEDDKEEEQDLKEEEKDAAEDDKEEEQDLKEEEKDAAEDDKEEENDLMEEEKEADKEARKAEKEADKIEKDSSKDNKKSK
jgi:hypothetical protein